MREILFRGKRLDNSEWVVGDFLHDAYISEPKEFVVIWNLSEHTRGAVDPATVGQFTGLTDKNGKKIFEGDIVKAPDVIHCDEIRIKGNVFVVRFGNGLFYLNRKGGNALLNKTYEVIGNIHDNPELLNGGE